MRHLSQTCLKPEEASTVYQACQTEARRADQATELATINHSEVSLEVLQEKILLEDCQRSVEYPTPLANECQYCKIHAKYLQASFERHKMWTRFGPQALS